jgi:hypothetical protein
MRLIVWIGIAKYEHRCPFVYCIYWADTRLDVVDFIYILFAALVAM